MRDSLIKMKIVYPVIFTKTEDNKILVEVPDLEILTEGKDMVDGIEMARDAIGLKIILYMEDNLEVPEPSTIEKINMEESTFATEGVNYLSLVDIDVNEYRRKIDNKTIRRNVTLPNWLNYEAEKAQINVSKVLQEALMNTLKVTK